MIWACTICAWTVEAAANPEFCDECGNPDLAPQSPA